jgi:predicted nucleotidyltransferase
MGAVNLSRPLTLITPTVDADVLAVLAGASASFTGRQVHRLAGRRSERGVRNALHRLCEQGVVVRQRVGTSDLYTLNRAHLAAPHIEGLAQLREEFLRRISTEFETWEISAEYAALFGSAARGDMAADSDIDLLIVRSNAVDVDDDQWRQQLAELASDVTAWTGNDARVFELNTREVQAGLAADETVLSDIRDEGVTLYGPSIFLQRTRRRVKSGARGHG